MIDITTLQTFDVPLEIKVLNHENKILKNENEGIKIIVSTIICLALGVGLYILVNQKNEEY